MINQAPLAPYFTVADGPDYPIPSVIIEEGLGMNKSAIHSLKTFGALKKYLGKHRFYSYNSFIKLKEFAEDFKSEYGDYPKVKSYYFAFAESKKKG